MTSPMYSSGTTTSTSSRGSSSVGRPFLAPSFSAMEPAILNAISDESTSWYEPSIRLTLMSTIGKPARTPVSMASMMPASTGAMYSRGTEPPTILLSNEKPDAGFDRFEDQDDVAVLAPAARLADEAGLGLLDLLLDGLAVGHLRTARRSRRP